MTSPEAIIEMKDLKKAFGPRTILSSLDLTLHRGDFVAIYGVSGSGKSTLLNILGLFDRAYHGSYTLMGTPIRKKTPQHQLRSKHIGFIFQLYHLLPKLTLIENITLPTAYRQKDNHRSLDLDTLLDDLSLRHIMDQSCDTLSGGEKQRVAIARALINNPDILICDEPTGNLDDENEQKVLKILKAQQHLGKTVIIVTHSRKIAKYANRTLYLKEGRLLDEKHS